MDKLFEIGKNFRNEGLSRKHNPEFTMLEAYLAFGDYETMMEMVESLITTVRKKFWDVGNSAKCKLDIDDNSLRMHQGRRNCERIRHQDSIAKVSNRK